MWVMVATTRVPVGSYMEAERDASGLWSTVFNKKHGSRLGYFEWYPAWRCWVFHPEHGTVFNDGCLRALADYSKTLGGKP